MYDVQIISCPKNVVWINLIFGEKLKYLPIFELRSKKLKKILSKTSAGLA